MHETISPELALVDPELAARARAALPYPDARPAFRVAAPTAPRPAPGDTAAPTRSHPYPLWARVTAALWLLVVGILIGGAAVPHAQDRPRVLTPAEERAARICQPASPDTPATPGLRGPLRPGP